MGTGLAKKSRFTIYAAMVAIVLGLAVFSFGCRADAASYQADMSRILEKGAEDLIEEAERIEKGDESDDLEDREGLVAELKVVKRIKREIGDAGPPDTLEDGHTELIAFLDFLIGVKEDHLVALEEGRNLVEEDQLSLADDYRETAAAMKKAQRELDVLEDEIKLTFDPLLPPLLKGL